MDWKETYSTWKQFRELETTLKDNLNQLEKNENELQEAFYAPLEFGTAGMRGILGVGINRMNIYTVRQAANGLALFISTLGEDAKKRGVAIAYDSRHQSPEFAMESAKTLASHGIKSYVFESLRPTPELSFAVRYSGCVAGIMITASHNPANYNGFKVYGEDGAQMPPQDADKVTEFVRSVANPLEIEIIDDSQSNDFITIIGKEVDDSYLKDILTVTIDDELINRSGSKLNMVFTPLHGTGKMLGERALSQIGFTNVSLVEEQAIADPNFTTVTSPNPEELSAFEYAIRLGEELSADLLVATDPDADRLGAAVKLPNGEYRVLTGNQLASLMVHYILTKKNEKQELPENGLVLKSIVSSELPTRICEKYDVEMKNVLTGFKFIAEQIKEAQRTQSNEFLFGFEESYGYLVKPFVRDKDAIQALVLLAEMATYYMEKNQTLYDALLEIYKEFGYFKEKTISVTKSGMEGLKEITRLMQDIRNNLPTSFGGIKVNFTEDYSVGKRMLSDGKIELLDLPNANVLKFFLEDGSWIAIRPSGTEPKIKFYIGAVDETQEAVDNKMDRFGEELAKYRD
ncbi:phospho-sugar mutase [Melissococcus sp. OM08-11BH]|uniref:phospho-sugar mutase n=1 Tax=Melissococcus sp. OM08-11BH TaxID=2293110 RepID=UPI000E5004E6|nr:phospho-sugar mutase [Melissococcus sp. OM08-11BH]RGI30825.1 phospho-sugar mutase [Melissococcus sp. OM08-11BH]